MTIIKISKEKDVCIETISKDEFINVGDILKVDFESNPRYFKVIRIEALNLVELKIYAENYGYKDKVNNIDIRKLYGLDVEIVNDRDLISKLKKEACFC